MPPRREQPKNNPPCLSETTYKYKDKYKDKDKDKDKEKKKKSVEKKNFGVVPPYGGSCAPSYEGFFFSLQHRPTDQPTSDQPTTSTHTGSKKKNPEKGTRAPARVRMRARSTRPNTAGN